VFTSKTVISFRYGSDNAVVGPCMGTEACHTCVC